MRFGQSSVRLKPTPCLSLVLLCGCCQLPLSMYMNVTGLIGLSTYFPVVEIGQPKPGETVFVSGAGGAVGSLAGQLFKAFGCRVIGRSVRQTDSCLMSGVAMSEAPCRVLKRLVRGAERAGSLCLSVWCWAPQGRRGRTTRWRRCGRSASTRPSTTRARTPPPRWTRWAHDMSRDDEDLLGWLAD